MATLYLVATPLGNLEDITRRAVRILEQAEVIAAESVPRTRLLLRALGIKTRRVISCREANRKEAAGKISALLAAGKDVALVSDAGSPGLNDPAAAVVMRAVADGFRVSPVAGPSSLAAAWSVAGIDHAPFTVLGFLPVKKGEKQRLLQSVRQGGWPFMFFEAPHRLADTADMLAELMPWRAVVICREMTKLHEQIAYTTCRQLSERVRAEAGLARGELTLVVYGRAAEEETPAAMDDLADLEQLVEISQGMNPSQLAAFLAKRRNLPKDVLYKKILALKNKKTVYAG